MSNTIEISRDKVFKEYNAADDNTKAVLRNLYGEDMFNDELPTSVEDALQRIQASRDVQVIMNYDSKDPLIIWLQNVLRKAVIYQAANKSKVLNWNDHSKAKYRPYYNMGKDGAAPGVGFSFCGDGVDLDFSAVASRLCLDDSDHVEALYERFHEIEKAVMLG